MEKRLNTATIAILIDGLTLLSAAKSRAMASHRLPPRPVLSALVVSALMAALGFSGSIFFGAGGPNGIVDLRIHCPQSGQHSTPPLVISRPAMFAPQPGQSEVAMTR